MWTRRNVSHKLRFFFRIVGLPGFSIPMCCMVVVLLVAAQCAWVDAAAASAEQLIVRIVLNQEQKGDFFVAKMENGDFLVAIEDLEDIGVRLPRDLMAKAVEGSQLALRSIPGLTYRFDEATLSLELTAEPALLGRKIIDFKTKRKEKVYYPHDTSLFLNYGADYRAADGFTFSSFNLTSEVGLRTGKALILSDAVFIRDQNQDKFIRLQTRYTHDDRSTLRRFIVGDFFASSGELGSSVNVGGLSLRKVYRMDPYYVYYPTLHFSGQTALPSEAKIYLNDMLIKTEKLSPGEFELRNLTPYGAAGKVDVVLRDAFGREQRLNYPFYYADTALLKEGFHEYSYNLGFTREDYGSRGNRYGKLVFSAFHRYGVSESLTVGVHGEGKSDFFNLGPELTFTMARAGICSLSLSGSVDKHSGNGGAGIASYAYQGLHFGFNLSLAGYTRDYRNVADTQTDDKTRYSASCGVSYGNRLLGTLSLDFAAIRQYAGDDRDQGSVSYTRSITSQVSVSTTYRKVREDGDDADEFLIALNFTPKRGLFVSSRYEQTQDSKDAILSVQKNPPVGEGLSYRARVKRSEADSGTTWQVNPHLQYNGRYGIYEGGYEERITEDQRESQYQLSVAGALVYVGGTFGATRPVYDSFGLVHVGDVEGVRIRLNSEEVGETDASGNLFVPNLGSYTQNQIGIEARDIPMDYYLSRVEKLVSPPLRSGSCIPFVVKRMQPIFGQLAIRVNGELRPVEFLEVTCTVKDRTFVFPTGSGGEFDIDLTQSEALKGILASEETGCSFASESENSFLEPGTYQAAIRYEGRRRAFCLTIPDTDDPFIDLGQVIIEEMH
ncbi:sigma-fimbria biogenesis outer membrane usher protein [Syntrophotalea carbinolica DSM 2380]|uniref:Sigma-fimbria biogenesis outer membrane usher protein n=1 Tax=Syntrophotalea carbinolica (strain DSM 2380 / NBRC 103641 / GraBd1) TaxID=338963 RepID=Q3A2V9_SYNC1|nr:fimbria/pilus outer membrane usher protein [Syntrophotalea carbinolica]ABA89298.1 sigma-fimbria biogenesis outer membrane usher protein [Syntrophotalea carbinolica DSM 2380]